MPSESTADAFATSSRPTQVLSVSDGIAIVCGMVIGAGIFRAPAIVASNVSSSAGFLLAWALGGVVSLCGALVYAELSSRYPEAGGEYAFMARGLGKGPAFAFAWSRMTVIQTGSIAAVAFVFGDYASVILRLGSHGPALYAALGIVLLTALNLAGTVGSKTFQKFMQVVLVVALLSLGIAGLLVGNPPKAAAAGSGSFGSAMIFVLLTYGGWNEAAYLAGEVRNARRNMLRILIGGVLLVTCLYLLINIAYLSVLGLDGIRASNVVAADLMRIVAGEAGAKLLALAICLATITTVNAAIFTGARTTYAFGRDFALFARLGIWRERGSTPANALLLQGALALALVGAGALTPDGFAAMVAYTAPVFWTFFLLTAVTIFVFRKRDGSPAGYRVPLYPVIPAAFCLMCVYMLYSSVAYVHAAVSVSGPVIAGVIVMAAGIPVYLIAGRSR